MGQDCGTSGHRFCLDSSRTIDLDSVIAKRKTRVVPKKKQSGTVSPSLPETEAVISTIISQNRRTANLSARDG